MGIYSINNILENRIKKIKIKDTPLPYKDDRIDDHIEDYEDASGNEVIEDGETQDELEDEYEKFMSMTYAQRKASNDKSIELFGIDNIEHYNRLKSKLLKNNKYELSEGSELIQPSERNIQSLEMNKNHESIKYEEDKIKIAKEWSNSSMITIMTPDIYDADMLEKRWSAWKGMIYKHRKDSNSKCVELFNMDNQQMYEKLKTKFLRKNQSEPKIEDEYINVEDSSPIMTSESVIQEGLFKNKRNIDIALNVLNMNDEKIFKDLKQNGYKIILTNDERNINILYKYFDDTMPSSYAIHAINRTSKSEEKFVLISLYNKNTPIYHIFPVIKKNYKDKIDLYCIYDINGEYTYTIIDTLELVAVKENSICNLLENEKKKEYKREIKKEQLSILNYIDNLPYFSPDEMIDMGVYNYNGNFYSPIPDNNFINEKNTIKVKTWFENYNLLYHGIVNEDTDKYCRYRIGRLNKLYSDYDKLLESGNTVKINKRKQSILELGWNPEIKFTVKNRVIATNFLRESYNKIPIKVNDLSTLYNEEHVIQETKIDRNKYAVYVVLTYTGTRFGKLINKWSHGIYSHAALGLESDLKQLYSFNATVNGFSKESIESYIKENKDSLICTYAVYLNKSQYDKLKEKLEYFNNHKTRYGFVNIVGLILNKPIELAHDMICSQFVDSILKYAGISINDKQSSLVTPNDFYLSTSNKLIKLYEGKTIEYDNKKIENLIKLYGKKPVNEAKEFPIQFDKDGNLLIKNMKKLDYEAEYAKAHKLLVIYDQNNNIEGMKYELSKLWFMNNLLEKKIYDKKTNEEDKKTAQKARAKILNDFNLYLKKVQKIEQEFNFTEYYDETPFSDAMIKIDKNTVHHGARLIKAILR